MHAAPATKNRWRGERTASHAGVASRAINTLRSLLNHFHRLGFIQVSPASGVRIVAAQNCILS